MPERAIAATRANEVDDRAVVAIVADGEVRPVAALGPAHDDLIARAGVAHHVAGAAAFAPVALVSITVDGVVDEIDVALESLEFLVVHGEDLMG